MKTVLVTGATGFLGKHLVEQLKQRDAGARVRILRRGTAAWGAGKGSAFPGELGGFPYPGREEAAIETARGDVTSRDDLLRAAEGVSEIYHLAGIVSRNPKDAELLYRTHVEGTRNVCEAARRHGVQKIVFVSSSGTIAVSREPTIHKENSGYKHEVVGAWPYYLSKIFAEKLTLNYYTRHSLPVVVVNPSLILGPGDDRSSSTGDVALFLDGQILAVPGGGLNFVDARDAAAGLIAAMRSGKAGERYFLGGPNWTFAELIANLSAVSGRRPPKMRPSLRTSLLSARLLRRLLPLVGKSFVLDDESIKMSALFWYCDSSKARAELGFTTRDPLETLRETVEELRRRSNPNTTARGS